MRSAIAAPFSGGTPINPYTGRPVHNPVGILAALTLLALSSLGITAAVVARRRQRDYGRLRCAEDIPVVGVPVEYQGDYWADRGRGRYYEARRAGATSPEDVAVKIIELELKAGPDTGLLNQCLLQFPPHDLTHPRNKDLWEGLLAEVSSEMARERGVAA